MHNVLVQLATRDSSGGGGPGMPPPANATTLCGQVALMATVDVLVTSHGAQLTNFMFMRRGSVVIETTNAGFYRYFPVFKPLTAASGHAYLEYNNVFPTHWRRRPMPKTPTCALTWMTLTPSWQRRPPRWLTPPPPPRTRAWFPPGVPRRRRWATTRRPACRTTTRRSRRAASPHPTPHRRLLCGLPVRARRPATARLP